MNKDTSSRFTICCQTPPPAPSRGGDRSNAERPFPPSEGDRGRIVIDFAVPNLQHISIFNKLFFLFLFFSSLQNNNFIYAGNPQDDYHNNAIQPQSFNKDSLDFYRAQLKYPDVQKNTAEQEEWEQRQENEWDGEGNRTRETSRYDNSYGGSLGDFWVTLAKIVFFLLLALLIGFIIYKVSDSKRPTAKKKKTTRQSREIELEEIKENLHETDLQQLIKQATSSGDYQHAVSLYYLEVLKRLSAKNLIVWRKAKTNAEYLRESSQLDIAPQFRKLTHIFESIFYGEQEITITEFQGFQALFEDMLKTIDKTEALNG